MAKPGGYVRVKRKVGSDPFALVRGWVLESIGDVAWCSRTDVTSSDWPVKEPWVVPCPMEGERDCSIWLVVEHPSIVLSTYGVGTGD